MDNGPTVEFEGVAVVRESDRALCCRIMGREYWIAPGYLVEGSSVAHFGDRGVIVVTQRCAETHGLLPRRAWPSW